MESNYWSQLARGRYSRRRVLAGGTAVAGAAALLAAGCGDDSTSSTATAKPSTAASAAASAAPSGAASPAASPTAAVKRGGKITWPIAGPMNDVFDPHISTAQAAYFFELIGNLAVRPNADGSKLDGELVEKWEIPGDGTQVMLSIRQGVKWQNKAPINGRPWDAEDLAFNINRIAGKLDPAAAARYQRRSSLTGLSKAEAVDGNTVKVTLERPSSTFMNGLADYRNQMIPKDFLDKGGKFEDGASLVGTGPFIVTSFQNLGTASFKPNPDYWNKGQPYLDELAWQIFPPGDATAIANAFAQGQVDGMPDPGAAARDLIKKLRSNVVEEKWAFTNRYLFRFNVQLPVFKDPRVRRALQMVLDYKAANDASLGDGYWEYSAVMPSAFPESIQAADVKKLPGWNPATRDADIKTAKDLMSAAGSPDGDIKFKIMALPGSGSIFQDFPVRALDQWKKAWPKFGATIESAQDLASFTTRQVKNDYDTYFLVEYSLPDAALDMDSQFGATGGRNYSKFQDDAINGLIQKALSELNATARKQELMDAQTKLLDQMPVIIPCTGDAILYLDKKVQGLHGVGRSIGGGSYHDFLAFGRQISLA